MKYYPTDFLSALSKYDPRLEPESDFKSNSLLVEEKVCDMLSEIRDRELQLVVLVDDPNRLPFAGGHRIVKSIPKYQKVSRLLAQIFDEPHEIRCFIGIEKEGMLESLLQNGILSAEFIDVLDPLHYSDSILNRKRLREQGRHLLFASPLDVLDPPADLLMEIIKEQAMLDAVDIFCYGVFGDLSHRLLDLSDQSYMIASGKYRAFAEHLSDKYRMKYVNHDFFSAECFKIVERRGFAELPNHM